MPFPGQPGGLRRSGFTVVELMGVCILLGLLGTVAYVTWQSMLPRAELNSVVRSLAADIQEARSNAIARSARFEILYDFEGQDERGPSYCVTTPYKAGGGLAVDTGDPEREEELRQERLQFDWTELPDSVRFRKIVVDGIEYDKGILPIRFDPLGATSAHQIVLEQPDYGNVYTIEVIGLTGLFRFHEGEFVREPADERDFD